MGGFSARKAIQVIEHVEMVLAIEMLCACQAIDYLRPLKTTDSLELVHALVRQFIPKWDVDRFMAPEIKLAHELIQSGAIWRALQHCFTPDLHQPRSYSHRM